MAVSFLQLACTDLDVGAFTCVFQASVSNFVLFLRLLRGSDRYFVVSRVRASVACPTGDSPPDSDSMLSYICHHLSLVSFGVSNFSFVLSLFIVSLQCLDFA